MSNNTIISHANKIMFRIIERRLVLVQKGKCQMFKLPLEKAEEHDTLLLLWNLQLLWREV